MGEPLERLKAIAAIVGPFATVGTFIVLFFSLQTSREVAIDASRAWVAPVGFEVKQDLRAGADGSVRLYLENKGRTPALDLATHKEFMRISNGAPLSVGNSDWCRKLMPLAEGGDVLFPQSGEAFDAKEIKVPAADITEGVVGGQENLIMKGCVVYKTLGQTHRTSFCYIVVKGGVTAKRD